MQVSYLYRMRGSYKFMENLKKFKQFALDQTTQAKIMGGVIPAPCVVAGTGCMTSCLKVWGCSGYICNVATNQCSCTGCPQ